MAKKYLKKHPTSLALRKHKLKLLRNFILNPVRMAKICKTTENTGEKVGETGNIIHYF